MTELTMPDTTPAGARALYEKQYAIERYGMGNRRRSIAEPILKKEVERVIEKQPAEEQGFPINCCDVACGRGEMVDFLGDLPGGVISVGYEIVPSLKRDSVEIIDTLLDIPELDRPFHIVSCLDVLEHLAEVDMIAAITELWRITHTTLILAVSCVSEPSYCGNNIQLHPTQQPPNWWRDRIIEATGVTPEIANQKEGRHDRLHGKTIINYQAATFIVRRAGGDG
jgi:hypothetical protein